MPEIEALQRLALAAAIGFLVGFEREWLDSSEKKLRTFAGVRTFALVGFAGALAGFLGAAAIVAGLAAIAALTIVAYWAEARAEPGTGGTTEVAIIAVYLLGATAARGDPLLAAAGGVMAAILLALKPRTEKWTRAMTSREIGAALLFLVISVIILPILPDQGYGPYEALNPRRVWWMVVLISGLSFLGYWLAKLLGSGGVILTGVIGGLASSTATTLSLSRMTKAGQVDTQPAAAGIVAANVVMAARMGVLLAAISPALLGAIWPALLLGGLAGLGAAGALALKGPKEKENPSAIELGNPLELRPALVFAALIAAISLASRYASDQFGDAGLYVVAVIGGLADVDAVTLTTGEQAQANRLALQTAALAVLLAAGSNMVVKGLLTFAIAGAGAGVRVAIGFAIAAGGALAGLSLGAAL